MAAMLEQSSKRRLAGQPVELEIVKRTDNEGGFKVVSRRWVVERTLSWLRRNRRLMAHYEAFALIAEGYAKLAMICIMLKRFAGPKLSRATKVSSQALSSGYCDYWQGGLHARANLSAIIL